MPEWLVRLTDVQGRLAAHVRPLHRIRTRFRTLLLQGAVALLLLALGVVIGKTLAWIIIAVCVTVIVLLGLAGYFEAREKAAEGAATDALPTRRLGIAAQMGPFERWLVRRLDRADEHANDRGGLKDDGYLPAMSRWDQQNCEDLQRCWPHLLSDYRADPRGDLPGSDGIAAPYTVEVWDAFYKRRYDWLKTQLATLRAAPTADDLDGTLAEHEDNMRVFARRIHEQTAPGAAFDWKRCEGGWEAYCHENRRVLSRLELGAPDWVPFYRQNPEWYQEGEASQPEHWELTRILH